MAEKIINKDKYSYNPTTDVYIIPMKHRVKDYVIKGYKIRSIKRALSNFLSPSVSAFDIRTKFKIQEEDFECIKKAFDLTRETFPLSDEELQNDSENQSLEKLLEEKKTHLIQTFEKESWRITQKNSESWLEFQAKTLDPIALALENWTPPKLSKSLLTSNSKDIREQKDETLVIGLSDLHYGQKADKMYMYAEPEWSTEKTIEAVAKYARSIIDFISCRNYKFKKVILLGLGDLIHNWNGKTTRGTELAYDCVKEEQFDHALNSLYAFISVIHASIPNMEVHSVYGNHNYETEMALFRALDMGFNQVPTIKFFHYASRPASFREGNTLILADHGADPIERTYVNSSSDAKIQNHVQTLLLTKPELLVGVKERLFITADKHHTEYIEYANFIFIMLPTILGGDEHADRNNLRSRPRQTCLVLNEDGLKEIFHVTFD